MTWHMVYSTFIVSFSGGKPTKKLSNICSVWATFVLVQLSAPCDQLDHELISIYLIDYNHMKTFDNAGNIAPNHVSIWYIQFAYNVTLYLTVLCIAGQPPLLFLDLECRSESIFGIQSAPPLWTYIQGPHKLPPESTECPKKNVV